MQNEMNIKSLEKFKCSLCGFVIQGGGLSLIPNKDLNPNMQPIENFCPYCIAKKMLYIGIPRMEKVEE